MIKEFFPVHKLKPINGSSPKNDEEVSERIKLSGINNNTQYTQKIQKKQYPQTQLMQKRSKIKMKIRLHPERIHMQERGTGY